MCQFCHRHGEGKKWYLQAKNYSQDLLSDLRRRRFTQGAIRGSITRRMKKVHFGQVLPLEDVEAIFGFVNSIVRVPCICRHATLGREARYCYGVSMGPGGG